MSDSSLADDGSPKAEKQKNFMLYIGGSKRSFHCEVCGANVFHLIEADHYGCNGCHSTYSADDRVKSQTSQPDTK